MSKKVSKLAGALLFLSSLIVASGQSRALDPGDRQTYPQKAPFNSYILVPELSKYGSLVGLKDASGKNVVPQMSQPWREGYAIAYQVKNRNGVYQNRFVYVIGDQVSKTKLKAEGQKSSNSKKVITTEDKALELGRSVTWDEESNTLKSEITIRNISDYEIRLRAIEINIDNSLVKRLIKAGSPTPLNVPEPLPCRIKAGGIGECLLADGCPGCPCGDRCSPPDARQFLRKPMYSKPAYKGDIIGMRTPRFKNTMLGLSWVAGSNLAPSELKSGEQVAAHYWIIIPK